LEEPASLYRRALTILDRTVEPDHPNLLACRSNYAGLKRDHDKPVDETC
jgi:hypothetical protein